MSVVIRPDSGETWWTDVDHGAASRVKGFSTARAANDEPRQSDRTASTMPDGQAP